MLLFSECPMQLKCNIFVRQYSKSRCNIFSSAQVFSKKQTLIMYVVQSARRDRGKYVLIPFFIARVSKN